MRDSNRTWKKQGIHFTSTHHHWLMPSQFLDNYLSPSRWLSLFIYWIWCSIEHPFGQLLLPILAMLSHSFLCSSSWALNETLQRPGLWVRTMQQQTNHQNTQYCVLATMNKITSAPVKTRTVCFWQISRTKIEWKKFTLELWKPPKVLYISSALNRWEKIFLIYFGSFHLWCFC